MFEWLIIGGGVHGTHLSHALVSAGGVARDRVAVVDPWDHPLERFFRLTAATGMTYLRSPAVHHIDVPAYALLDFARRGAGRRLARFVPPYDRPGLAFFRAHCDAVVRTHDLTALRRRARAVRLDRAAGTFRVDTDQGALASRRVILAIGLSDQPCWPEWAVPLRQDGRAMHVFDGAQPLDACSASERVVVVGGGITAGQLACAFVDRGVRSVVLLSRHAPRVHRFDSDPMWLGPKGLAGFARAGDMAERRRMIAGARRRGSMPPELDHRVRVEVSRGRLERRQGCVERARAMDGEVRLVLAGGGELRADRVVLATGFLAHRPGGALVDDVVEREGLPCARCGYPIVSPRLEWTPGLFVSGPLAELELGPAARNIAGARAAAERIVVAA